MEKQKQPISVQQLIQQYQQELMELKDVHATTEKQQESIDVVAHLDKKYPFPNMKEDLERMRENTEIPTSQAEENAVQEETKGQTSTPSEPDTQILFPSDPPPSGMSLGYLRAFVTTARGTLPISNAQVIVTRIVEDNELLEQATRTDISGYTPLLSLPASIKQNSQTPQKSEPYTYYTMYVRANGFYPVRLLNIPMYGDITAVQPVDLIPVSEGDDPNKERTILEGAPENLS